MLTVIGLVIGVMIFGAGVYYLLKDRDDPESRKIYAITTAVGAVIVFGMAVKIVLQGI